MVDAAQQHRRSRSMQGCFNKISANNSNSEASLVNISYTCRRNVSSVGGRHRKLSISDSWGTSSSLLNWIIIVLVSLAIISKFQNFDRHPSQPSMHCPKKSYVSYSTPLDILTSALSYINFRQQFSKTRENTSSKVFHSNVNINYITRRACYVFWAEDIQLDTEIKIAELLYKTPFSPPKLPNHAGVAFIPERTTPRTDPEISEWKKHWPASPVESRTSRVLVMTMRTHTHAILWTRFEIAARRELLNVKQVGWLVTPNSCSEEQTTKEKEGLICIYRYRWIEERKRREKEEREKEWLDVVIFSAFSIFHDTRPFCVVPFETRKWKIRPCCLPGCFMKFNKYEMNLPRRCRRERDCVREMER